MNKSYKVKAREIEFERVELKRKNRELEEEVNNLKVFIAFL